MNILLLFSCFSQSSGLPEHLLILEKKTSHTEAECQVHSVFYIPVCLPLQGKYCGGESSVSDQGSDPGGSGF